MRAWELGPRRPLGGDARTRWAEVNQTTCVRCTRPAGQSAVVEGQGAQSHYLIEYPISSPGAATRRKGIDVDGAGVSKSRRKVEAKGRPREPCAMWVGGRWRWRFRSRPRPRRPPPWASEPGSIPPHAPATGLMHTERREEGRTQQRATDTSTYLARLLYAFT